MGNEEAREKRENRERKTWVEFEVCVCVFLLCLYWRLLCVCEWICTTTTSAKRRESNKQKTDG